MVSTVVPNKWDSPEETKHSVSKKTSTSGARSSKSSHRVTKRASPTAAHLHHHQDSVSQGSTDGRGKRVWKACERCRMKKTKCDGEFPCKRCKDDGLICTPGQRKRMDYKQVPKGYAEVLESSQASLTATIHKLYHMVRNGQQWNLPEPEVSERGLPIVHHIADRLNCIRQHNEIDLPIELSFPETRKNLEEVKDYLWQQQGDEAYDEQEPPVSAVPMTSQNSSGAEGYQRSSSSDLDHSDFELDHRAIAFGRANNSSVMTMSPQSLTTNAEMDYELSPDSSASFPPHGSSASSGSSGPTSSAQTTPPLTGYPPWTMPNLSSEQMNLNFLQQQQDFAMQNLEAIPPDMQSRLVHLGLMESEFGFLKPHVVSEDSTVAMMGLGDPMMYGVDYNASDV